MKHNPALRLPDGGRAELVEGALELRDVQGRLQIRYRDGVAELLSPDGDLVLGAPRGRVVLRAGTDVAIEAKRDLVEQAGRSASIRVGDETPQIDVRAEDLQLAADRIAQRARSWSVEAGSMTSVARRISVTAATLAHNVERYELTATRMVERARDAFREVSALWQTRAGRVRTLVTGSHTQHARRTLITSDEDTSVDGKRVLLG